MRAAFAFVEVGLLALGKQWRRKPDPLWKPEFLRLAQLPTIRWGIIYEPSLQCRTPELSLVAMVIDTPQGLANENEFDR
jgi:hypothetical protein